MSLVRPTQHLWLKPDCTPVLVQTCSPVSTWFAHYDPLMGYPVRCSAAGCRYCDKGQPPQVRYVVGVITLAGERKLLELRAPQFDTAFELDRLASNKSKTVLEVQKLGQAKNSKLSALIVHGLASNLLDRFARHNAEWWDITELVESFGRPPDPVKASGTIDVVDSVNAQQLST